MAKLVMDDGGLVGDEIMVGLIRERLSQADAMGRGYILDGFPRTVPQAVALDEISTHLPIDVVIDVDVPREVVLNRLSARRVCRDCGTNYVSSGIERLPWICEVCGGDVVRRDDDTPEAISHRLDLYDELTQPLIAYYQSTSRLCIIDGVASADEVSRRITAAVEEARQNHQG